MSTILTSYHYKLKETQQKLFEQLLETYMSRKKGKQEHFADYVEMESIIFLSKG